MLNTRKASTEDIPLLQSLSHTIWHQVYPGIVTVGQIDYMLNMMYSNDALHVQMNEKGHVFLVLEWMDEAVGFVSYSINKPEDPLRYRIHKLYVQPTLHGKGIGKAAVQTVAEDIAKKGGKQIELNVNKRNPAVGFYEKIGFYREQELVVDIGNGYLMDDFIMVMDLP